MIALGPKPTEKGTGLDVISSWEKMSKSKHNGVDPEAMLKDYGTDTTRLLILADVAPTSHRHWSSRSKCLVPHIYILTLHYKTEIMATAYAEQLLSIFCYYYCCIFVVVL